MYFERFWWMKTPPMCFEILFLKSLYVECFLNVICSICKCLYCFDRTILLQALFLKNKTKPSEL